MKRRLIVAGGVLLGLLTLAGATYAPPLSLDQQAVKAEVIVRATVGTPATVQESAQSWTVYPITVLETLAGDAAALPKYQDKPAVWVLGGLTDGPTLRAGEAMLLLYKARTDSPLVGFTQGQYSVEGEAERKLVSGLPDGTQGVAKAPPPVLTTSAGASTGATTPSAATPPSAATTTPSAATSTPSAASITPSAGTPTTPLAGSTTAPSAATITPSAATTTPSAATSTPSAATITAPITTPSAVASTTTPSAAASTKTPSSATSSTSTPSAAASGTATPSTATTPSATTAPSSAAMLPAPTPPPTPAALGPGQLGLDAFRQAVLAARAKAGK